MKILVANDDGIDSEGLYQLVKSLNEKHDVTVVAPEIQRSGAAHSATVFSPIIARQVGFRDLDVTAYSITGMPSDCVKLGICNLLDEMPNAVFSGINCGPNLGTDTLYSGTVAAAMEGTINCVKSVAVSTMSHYPSHYETAAQYASVVADWLVENDLPVGTMLNINVPDLPAKEVRGVVFKRLGYYEYEPEYVGGTNPRGESYFWHPLKLLDKQQRRQQCDVDFEWCENGYIVVSPLHWDWTDVPFMKELEESKALQFDVN